MRLESHLVLSLTLIVAAAATISLPAPAGATGDAIDYEEYARRIRRIDLDGRRPAGERLGEEDEYGAVSVDSYTYVAVGDFGVDIHADDGEQIGSFGDEAFDVVASPDGTCLWVAGMDVVRRYDLSDPENPTLVETIDLGPVGDVGSISLSGNDLVVQYGLGAVVVRLTSPCGPSLTSAAIPFAEEATLAHDAHAGTAAFVGSAVLVVSDLTMEPPTSLVTTVPGTVRDVALNGNHEIVLATGAGVKRYGTSPPIPLGENIDLTNIVAVARAPGTSTIAAGEDLVHVLSEALERIGTLRGHHGVRRVSSHGDRFLTRRGGTSPELVLYRHGNGMTPSPLARLADEFVVPAALTRPMGNHMLMSDSGGMSGGRIRVYDVINPCLPVLLGETGAAAVQRLRHYKHELLRVAAGGPTERSLAVAGGLAGFDIVDFTDPANPAIVGSLPGFSSSVDATPDGSRVVRSSSSPLGFYVVDVSTPEAPFDRGFGATPNAVNEFHVDGTFAVVATTSQTARWDVGDPDAPVIDHVTPLTGVESVAPSSVPEQVYLGSSVEPGARVVRYDFAVGSEVASIDVGARTLAVVSSDGGAPTGAGEIVYAGTASGTLYVIDWSDPIAPVLVGEYTEPGLVLSQIAADEETVMLTNGSYPGDIVVLPAHALGGALDTPPVSDVVTRLVSRPNPFRSSTTLAFTLEWPTDVRVGVFDVRGRSVRTLLAGGLDAGRHDLAWDGLDDRGRVIASGVYVVRLDTGARTDVRRVVRLP